MFIGYGTEDNKTPYKNGKSAAGFLRIVGAEVKWMAYGDLGYWSSEDMLQDIVTSLRKREGWEDSGFVKAPTIDVTKDRGDS